MKKAIIYCVILFCFFPIISLSQTDTLQKSKQSNALMPPPINDSMKTSKIKIKKFEMQKSPMGAALRSFVFPGWGQLYVEAYWKAPLVTGACGFLTYMIVDYNKKFTQKSDLVNSLKAKNPNDASIFIEKLYRENYRDNRDMSAFYLLAVYVVAAVDCYTDAHLFDFNVDDKFSLGFTPNYLGGTNLTFSYKIW